MKPISFILLIFASSLNYGIEVFGQEKVNVSTGLGVPELLNVGVRYQLQQTEIGFSVGSFPLDDQRIISFSGDFFYHFRSLSKLSERRLWYGRLGLNYLRNESEIVIDHFVFLNLRIGRDINISRKMGIKIDAGPTIELFKKTISKGSFQDFSTGPLNKISLGIGIELFYRI